MNLKEMILKNLENNGFPVKKVSFDLEKLYELADNKGENLNAILENLKSEHSIEHDKNLDKIIFKSAHGQNPDEMMKKAQEMMSKMSPDELAQIQKQFESMTPEQKEEMIAQAKKMGLA